MLRNKRAALLSILQTAEQEGEAMEQKRFERQVKRRAKEQPDGITSAIRLANRCWAFRLKEANYPLEVIAHLTKIPLEEVERLQTHPFERDNSFI